ncbi:MAG: ABC transporter permease [Bacteroidales bacterium]
MNSGTIRKVARSILRNKTFLLFNILGLAVGILCLVYSSLYIIHETKVDRYNLNFSRIYRVVQKSTTDMLGSSPYLLKPLLENIPEIETSARFIKSSIAIKKKDEFIVESNLKYIDKEMFKIFTIPIIYGNVNNFLNEPNSIIITQDISEKYFGKTNPVGAVITTRLDGKDYDLRVDGVVKNFPDYSSFQAKMFVNFDMYAKCNNITYQTKWVDWGFTTVILIKPSVDKSQFEHSFQAYFENYFLNDPNQKFSVQPLSSIYFHSSHLGNNKFIGGNLDNLILLGSICFIIFLVSFVNFTLLSIANKHSNLKEIGVIKVLGAQRWDYIKTITVESLIIAFITLILTNIFLILILKQINQLLDIDFAFNLKESFSFYLTCLIITFGASFISGLYIASVLFRINPLAIFRQNAKFNLTNNPFVKTLIICQLTSICILFGVTVSFNNQLSRIFQYNMGYESSNLMVIDIHSSDKDFNYNVLLALLRKYPNVLNASASDCSIHDLGRQTTTLELRQGIDPVETDYMNVESNYFETLNLKLASGRLFMPNDSNSIIINETLAKLFPSNPIGQILEKKTIIGIVKDFRFRSFYNPITPLTIQLFPSGINQIVIKFVSPVNRKSIADLRKIVTINNPGLMFDIHDYKSKLEATYTSEFKLKALFRLFVILSVILVFSALLGFSYYITQSKTKEICIRKIHGAGTISILWLISKDFLPLVFISNLIALPFAYLVIKKLLNQFLVQVPFNFGSYLITLISTCLFVFIILVLRTVFVLRQNLVQHLKSE